MDLLHCIVNFFERAQVLTKKMPFNPIKAENDWKKALHYRNIRVRIYFIPRIQCTGAFKDTRRRIRIIAAESSWCVECAIILATVVLASAKSDHKRLELICSWGLQRWRKICVTCEVLKGFVMYDHAHSLSSRQTFPARRKYSHLADAWSKGKQRIKSEVREAGKVINKKMLRTRQETIKKHRSRMKGEIEITSRPAVRVRS